ncbi:MAG: TolC family protein [Planctomycetes bacterium]|nr:TolC family protein [Planctomycetota bacterium]
MQGRAARRRTPKLLLSAATLGVGLAGCRQPLDSIQMVLDRHQKAYARLPEEDRARLMPVGEPVSGEAAEELLPTDMLTLQQARAIAIRANPDIHAAKARFVAAAARIAEARSRYLPTVIFSYNAARTFHTPASRNRLNTLLQPALPAPIGVDSTNFTVTTLLNALRRPLFGPTGLKGDRNSFSEHSTAFTSSWTAFDGFVREAQLMSAKHVYHASHMGLADVERLLIQAVDRAYYQVQLSEEQVRIARADESFSQEQHEETEKLRAAGRASQADVDNFRVRMLAAQANLTAALGLKETGRVVLAELMGLADVTLPGGLPLSTLADETESELQAPSPGPWIEQALKDRPDVLQMENLLRSEEEQVRAAKGLYNPSVVVSGSWGYDRPSNLRYSVEDQSSALAMEFRWEIFTGGARQARVRQAEAQRAEAAAQLNRLRLSVQSDVRRALIDLQNAQQQIRLQRESLKTARENRRIVQAGYVAGKETLNRLNEVQRDYIAAEAELARARIRLREAWSDLHAAAATYRKADDGGTAAGAGGADGSGRTDTVADPADAGGQP